MGGGGGGKRWTFKRDEHCTPKMFSVAVFRTASPSNPIYTKRVCSMTTVISFTSQLCKMSA